MYKLVSRFEYTNFVTESMKKNKNIRVETRKCFNDSDEINLVQIIDNDEVIAYRQLAGSGNKKKFENYIWVGDKNDKGR